MADPQDTARDRQRERAARVESILEAVDPELDRHAYPTNSEALAAEYRAAELDVPGETETFEDALDRLADRHGEFANAEEARAALTTELRRDEAFDDAFSDEPSEQSEE